MLQQLAQCRGHLLRDVQGQLALIQSSIDILQREPRHVQVERNASLAIDLFDAGKTTRKCWCIKDELSIPSPVLLD